MAGSADDPAAGLVAWTSERLDELVALVQHTLPDERLTADELESTCFDDGGAVIGSPDGLGAVAVVRRARPGRTLAEPGPGFVRLLAVDPRAQRAGLGRALLGAAHDWLFEHGADEVRPGGEAPFYLWPGVDVRATAALCLFESAGYVPVGAEVNLAMGVPLRTSTAGPVPGAPRFAVRRALDDDAARAALEFVAQHAPHWVPEMERALEHGSCHVAVLDGGRVAGVGCHSVNRAGWVGPLLTDPAHRAVGIGRALLVEISRDLSSADLRSAEIAWIGPLGFYVRAADAWVSRVFRTLRLPRPPD
jgi:GNAT superfamily N-acetyltransferase